MIQESNTQHVSVMRNECIELLSPAISAHANPVVIDATLGLGGHTEALLNKFPQLVVIGIDRDTQAIEIATERLSRFGQRFISHHSIFDRISDVAKEHGYSHVQGILFDLGVSSLQLDNGDRGFSYAHDASLDMRMDKSQAKTAADIVNTYSPGELVRILRTYGEEKFATRIVESIVKEREKAPLNSTSHLATLVKNAIPAATRRTGGNPAKRTFQALRIETNDELGAITRAIPQALELLDIHARLVVMSFQSLEDRIVKNFFQEATTSGTPQGLPVEIAELAAKFALVFNGSQSPSEAEVEENSRAASVRLRAIERVAA
jgi:16S rRNA (cytosine1402-N4)-methyltransferase|uniref:16S rRNA (cytosine(1402)-N(4))-methyltransferase RsmH n=1 Tax=Candidatus Planktophila sp. TaxID=2175601 RepID=UPI00404AD0A8